MGFSHPVGAPSVAARLKLAAGKLDRTGFSSIRTFRTENKKGHLLRGGLFYFSGGPDGTRTRDLRRDRPAF